MKTKHWFCWHDWNKWGRPLQTYSGHKSQWRECAKCGLVRFRILRWDKQTETLAVHRSLDLAAGVEKTCST